MDYQNFNWGERLHSDGESLYGVNVGRKGIFRNRNILDLGNFALSDLGNSALADTILYAVIAGILDPINSAWRGPHYSGMPIRHEADG
jgi:hypothetical protein